MTQEKLNELFTSNKRRILKHDEFDELFENPCTNKRRRINEQSNDIFDFSPKTTLKTKRNRIFNEDKQTIDDIFNDDRRKKLRQSIKTEQTEDIFDLFSTQSNISKSSKQKKIQLFFDPTDLQSIHDSFETKDYIEIKPVVITSSEWLSSKSTEIKTIDIPNDERNLMHIQYVPLINEEKIHSKSIIGKSFHKQSIITDSSILRKENLQSCYNGLLEDVNKSSRLGSTNQLIKSTTFHTNDDEQNFDFFDLSTRRKKR